MIINARLTKILQSIRTKLQFSNELKIECTKKKCPGFRTLNWKIESKFEWRMKNEKLQIEKKIQKTYIKIDKKLIRNFSHTR